MRTRISLAALCLCIAATPGVAQRPVKHASRCSGSTQADLYDCAKRDYEASQAALAAAYHQAMQTSSGEERKWLDEAQSTFRKYQEAQCAYVAASVRGGSMESQQVFSCLAELNRQRIRHLRWTLPGE